MMFGSTLPGRKTAHRLLCILTYPQKSRTAVRAIWDRTWFLAAIAAPSLIAACTVGPDYQKPAAPVPAAYKEAAGWQ
jgi:hypothetical protein